LSQKFRPARPNPSRRIIRRAGCQSILYCVLALSATLAALLSSSLLVSAQQDAPEIKPLERKFNKKKDQGPRALGLMQLASNGKATLVPIAIRIGGRFYDAAEYKANPVPMALESGTVYEAERTGKSLGLFTVNGAWRSNSVNAAAPWIGSGLWLPEGAEAPKSGRRAESVPVGIESDDAPPRLTKGGSPKAATPEPPPAQTPSTGSSSEPKPPTESKPPASNPTSSPAKPPSDSAKKAEPGPPSDDSNSSAGDSNRPRLRRGKPTEPLPSDDEIPGYSKPGSPAPKSVKGAEPPPTNGTAGATANAAVDLIPAVSDADGPNPRSYAFEWAKGEEATRRKQLLDLATDQLRLYVAKQLKSSTSTNPAAPKSASQRPAPKPPEPVLDNIEMRTFDLWANNQPIMILTAQAHMPPSPAKNTSASAPDSSLQYTITLVARTDIYDNLHKLYSAVTDKYHLDVTPRLELIDAVDVDGDGRGELLFREISDASSGYVIYRATADTLWKMFDSLNPE
jgi:hypothetical protein